MGVLKHTQIDDFVATTLNAILDRGKWTDISLDHQSYISSYLIDEKKVVESGAAEIEFLLQTRNTGLADNVGLFSTDRTGVEDVMRRGKVGWTKQTVNFSYDIDEPLFQSPRETIVRELVVREHDAKNSLAELNEENLWNMPAADATDARPNGIPYWLVKDATTTPGGAFNGGNPTGHTSCANINSTAVANWRNWTFGYTAVTPEDMVAKLKKAIAFTRFEAPVPHPELGFGKSDYNIYTTYRVTSACELLAESRNDNLKNDLARYMNAVVVGGIPMKWVPYLEANDTSDPLYGINWKTFRPYVKSGCQMRRSAPKQSPTQHTVRTVFYDTWMNYICVNRRLNFVGSTS